MLYVVVRRHKGLSPVHQRLPFSEIFYLKNLPSKFKIFVYWSLWFCYTRVLYVLILMEHLRDTRDRSKAGFLAINGSFVTSQNLRKIRFFWYFRKRVFMSKQALVKLLLLKVRQGDPARLFYINKRALGKRNKFLEFSSLIWYTGFEGYCVSYPSYLPL